MKTMPSAFKKRRMRGGALLTIRRPERADTGPRVIVFLGVGNGMKNSKPDDEALLGMKKVRELLGNCSDMHIWRLINAAPYASLKFPKPIKIMTRNYWRRREILGWIEAREKKSSRHRHKNRIMD